jgi:DNA-damage-inducible protein D
MTMSEMTPNPETRVALFQRKEIRRTIHHGEWWFVITDVVGALTDSVDPSDYLKKMRKRDPDLAAVLQGGGQFVPPLESSSILRVGARNSNAGIPKAYSG